MNARTSTILQALEIAWSHIQARYPHVQNCLFVTYSQTLRRNQMYVTRGHYYAKRWTAKEHDGKATLVITGNGATKTITIDRPAEATDELYISSNILKEGAESVFTTLLHEAVHSANNHLGIKDCSRGNRYHNRQFQARAEEMLLACEHTDDLGYSTTKLTDAARKAFAEAIATLHASIVAWQDYDVVDGIPLLPIIPGAPLPPTTPALPKGRLLKATCQCGRIIRIAATTFEQGPIHCGACDTDFELETQ